MPKRSLPPSRFVSVIFRLGSHLELENASPHNILVIKMQRNVLSVERRLPDIYIPVAVCRSVYGKGLSVLQVNRGAAEDR